MMQLSHWKRRTTLNRGGIAAAVMIAAVATLLGGATASQPPAVSPSRVMVVDGDTIHLRGDAVGTRLVGFNAPETSRERARCWVERRLGYLAKERLKEIVGAGNLSLESVACACPPATEGTPACNYGRHCGVLRANGRDVGAILIAEGLAVPYVCGRTGCGPSPSPWCN
jgi:endonuclease YncB( thermonuclease family)